MRLKKTIGESYNVDLYDTLRTKSALRRIGYYEPPKSHGVSIGMTKYPDDEMFDGLKRFQRDQGLVRDGVMKPGGPTANRLGLVMGRLAAMEQRPTKPSSTPHRPKPTTIPARPPAKPDPMAALAEAIARIPKKSLLSESLRTLDSEVEPDGPNKPSKPEAKDPGTPPRKPQPPSNDDKPEEQEPEKPDRDEDDKRKGCERKSRSV